MSTRRLLVAPLALGAVLLLVAAGTGAAGAEASSHVSAAGKLTFCSDITYPPEEFYKGARAVGSDIDIGTEIARRLGLTAQFQNTTFDSIIAALLAKKCDAIISGMNDTPQRRKVVSFVDYLKVGQSLMVKKGNPEHITTLSSLSGKRVGVEAGTTNRDFLAAESKKLTAQGKNGITIVTYPKDTDAVAALKTGRLDAYFSDSPVVAYYIGLDPSSFAFGGQQIRPILVGIALRKGDPLIAKVQKAVTGMYAGGTMSKILTKWKMTGFALKK